MKIALLGYGTIGRFIADKALQTKELELAFVVDPYAAEPESNDIKLKKVLCEDDLQGIDLVVEAANADVVVSNAQMVLKHCSFLTFSATAFSDSQFHYKITQLCKETGHRLYIPHGAILGLDGVFDGRELLTDVSITTIKKPKGLGVTATERTILFSGSAREACRLFPRNVNVHAGLSLAGIGFDRTKSVIIADPNIDGNTHIISLIGEGINFEIKIASVPKGLVSGVYTPYSAFGSILRILGGNSETCIV